MCQLGDAFFRKDLKTKLEALSIKQLQWKFCCVVGLILLIELFLPQMLISLKKIDIFFGSLYCIAHFSCHIYYFSLQSYRAKSKNLFSPSISTSDDLQCASTTTGSNPNMLSQSLSVGGLQSNTPSLAAIHSNSCGSPNNFNNLSARDVSGLGNSTENSLKVTKSSKPINRWSGLWGSSSKVKYQ